MSLELIPLILSFKSLQQANIYVTSYDYIIILFISILDFAVKISLKKMENSPVYILLPCCVEFKNDVFLNVLKNVVGRVRHDKLSEHYIDNAFKSGMMAEDIVVDEDDLSLSWKNCQSEQKLIRQAKLLGFWSATNCPTFGKVFFKNKWRPPRDNFIEVESKNGTKRMTAADFDLIIVPKLKCCVVELNVCKSTLVNLKHFVTVPRNEIDMCNGFKFSTISTIFDVKEDFVGKCWKALKCGKWLMNTDTEVRKFYFNLK